MLEYMRIRLRGMIKNERGASAVEYGLLIALIALLIVAAVFALGGTLRGMFEKVNTGIQQT